MFPHLKLCKYPNHSVEKQVLVGTTPINETHGCTWCTQGQGNYRNPLWCRLDQSRVKLEGSGFSEDLPWLYWKYLEKQHRRNLDGSDGNHAEWKSQSQRLHTLFPFLQCSWNYKVRDRERSGCQGSGTAGGGCDLQPQSHLLTGRAGFGGLTASWGLALEGRWTLLQGLSVTMWSEYKLTSNFWKKTCLLG